MVQTNLAHRTHVDTGGHKCKLHVTVFSVHTQKTCTHDYVLSHKVSLN